MDTSTLSISVAVMPEGDDISINSEMELIRPALLYGDSVNVYSPGLVVLSYLDSRKNMGGLEYLDFARAKALETGQLELLEEMVQTMSRLETLKGKSSLTSEESEELERLLLLERKMEEGYQAELRPKVLKQLKDAGFNEVRKAINEGLLSVEPLLDPGSLLMDSEGDKLVGSYFDSVSKIISQPHTFPLLDSFSIKIAQALVEDGMLPASLLDNKHAKEVHLATEIMRIAPSFPRANVWDIIDIRRELRNPLVRFRSAVMKLSKLIEEPVFGDEFVAAAQDLIRQEMNPALVEIEERIENNKYLKRLTRATTAQAATAFVTGISILSGTQFGVPVVVSGILAAAGTLATTPKIVASAINEYWNMKDEHEEIQKQDLYLVAEMNRTLSKSGRS